LQIGLSGEDPGGAGEDQAGRGGIPDQSSGAEPEEEGEHELSKLNLYNVRPVFVGDFN